MEKYIGKVCPFCKTEIKEGDAVKVCPSCGRPHHEHCWEENNGCASCDTCGVEMKEGDTACSLCDNTTEQTDVDRSKPTQENNAAIKFATAEQKAQVLSDKISKVNTFFPIGGIISGILSVIFGLRMFGKDVGGYESSAVYGGDAYTGIQNAAAQTANNVNALSEIVRDGFAFFLIAVGLIAVFYFAMKLSKNGNTK